jgi:transcriptional regulator with XRE-family HTH domain
MSKRVAQHVGKRIKQLREAAQLTQSDLASLTLKSVETISNFERGKTAPSLNTLDSLAKHLGVNIMEFFDATPIQIDANPVERAIRNKALLLSDKDRELLIGIANLMIAKAKNK